MRQTKLPSPSDKWTRLGTQDIWEHTEWLNPETLNKYLHKSFSECDLSHYMDLPGTSTKKRVSDLLHREAPFIALVNGKDEFKSLLDRGKPHELEAHSLPDE